MENGPHVHVQTEPAIKGTYMYLLVELVHNQTLHYGLSLRLAAQSVLCGQVAAERGGKVATVVSFPHFTIVVVVVEIQVN